MQEFAVQALKTLHLNELLTYLPNLTLWLMPVAALLGLLCCFFGYKLRNLWFAGVCLAFGCFAGWYLYTKGILDINFSIAAGLLAAALFVFTYRLACLELAFCFTYQLLISRFGLGGLSAIIPSILLVIVAIFLDRWVVTVITAVFGAAAFINYLPMLQLPFLGRPAVLDQLSKLLAPGSTVYLATLVVLSVLGFLCQAGLLGNDPLFHMRRK